MSDSSPLANQRLRELRAQQQAAQQAYADAENQRRKAWERNDRAFCDIYPNANLGQSRSDDAGWIERIAAYCQVARETGFGERFAANEHAGQNARDALSLIVAGLNGDKCAITERVLELAQAGQEGWPLAFNADLGDFLGSLNPLPPVLQVESSNDATEAGQGEPAGSPSETATTPTRPKRSTERGEGRAKLISALTWHHDYAEDGCLNQEPIGNNQLAREAGVSDSTASEFFNKEFNHGEKGGYAKYRVKCRDAGALAYALKALRGEFTPAELSQMTEESFKAGQRLSDEE